ncbi:cupin domain-containing protein [Nocardia puris]|uniref:Quercetin dioxygenase-like cupin family protein n=1 Tax=Nocardia puris TaxID=208602 RepID=A0A366DWK4_9NOCA|nr:cupin domain-containing protein [Nocardia puris]MBF6209787.1 cupin domain-containing protein [Nocardia puris]MBF6366359.1 cupin domain-containing protein [Nocardia puris]MBF6458302.1 cupin domain-containing protein [Nocardia puris]RBO94476.1 quercetin dioxygenase-like cupin family protein [Nocardia puris]
MTAPTRPAALVHPDEAETIGTDTARVRLLLDADRTGDSVSTVEVILARGADGAAPHFHTKSDELFVVTEGEIQVLAGEEIVTVGAGGALVVPKFMPHAFGATPDSTARLVIALMPGVRRFGYFRLLDRLARGEATFEDLAASQDEYDNHFVDAPAWWAERNAHRA